MAEADAVEMIMLPVSMECSGDLVKDRPGVWISSLHFRSPMPAPGSGCLVHALICCFMHAKSSDVMALHADHY